MQQFDSRYGMPRNTHVYVDFEFRNYSELNAAVTLVPYIGINLNPPFGFDNLLEGDHNPPPTDW